MTLNDAIFLLGQIRQVFGGEIGIEARDGSAVLAIRFVYGDGDGEKPAAICLVSEELEELPANKEGYKDGKIENETTAMLCSSEKSRPLAGGI